MQNNNLLLLLWQARHQFDVVQLPLPWCSELPSPPKTTNEFWFLFIKCIINSSSRFLFVFLSCSLVPELENVRVFPCGNFCSKFNIIPQNSILFPNACWQVHAQEILDLQIFNCKNNHRLSAACILSPTYKDSTDEEFWLFVFLFSLAFFWISLAGCVVRRNHRVFFGVEVYCGWTRYYWKDLYIIFVELKVDMRRNWGGHEKVNEGQTRQDFKWEPSLFERHIWEFVCNKKFW